MQAYLQKIVLQDLLYSMWVTFFQTLVECVSQSLFYKLLFYYFAKNRVQTLFLLFYASKSPFCQVYKVLLENLILS
jgi:hypothetical protein